MCRSLRNRIIGGATVGAALLLGSLSAFATNSLDCASGTGFGRNQLRVVGLTGDGQLVCFNEKARLRARAIGYVSGLSARTPR